MSRAEDKRERILLLAQTSPQQALEEAAQLVNHIRQVHAHSKGRYGSPRIRFELQEKGIKASRPRIARLKRKHQVQSIIRKK